ncbi:MAG TPA: DUF4087 domain-containing protein [Pyrinomonadaceae bacterium]|nr:DUF4087 domain-containing protein [Pyrinomonadaceae bacterium]
MKTRFATPRPIIFSCLLLTIALAGSMPATSTPAPVVISETRCGWFSNPTPANASLHDREAEWIVGVQGGHQAEGDWPEFSDSQWVKTNNHYGYGCACMRVQVDRDTKEVIRIESAQARALSACRRDPALKRWGFK